MIDTDLENIAANKSFINIGAKYLQEILLLKIRSRIIKRKK